MQLRTRAMLRRRGGGSSRACGMFQRCRPLGPGGRRRRRRATGRGGELPPGLGPGPRGTRRPRRACPMASGAPKLEAKPTYKVGFGQTESNNPWRLAQTASMQDEATKLGYQLTLTDAGTAAKQVQDVNSMIAQKPST